MKRFSLLFLLAALCLGSAAACHEKGGETPDTPSTPDEPVVIPETHLTVDPLPLQDGVLYTYKFSPARTPEGYDEAVTTFCIQGLLNRAAPRLYITSSLTSIPQKWQDTFSSGGRWLSGRATEAVPNFEVLMLMALNVAKGSIIWDPEVPATLNVATTMAGVYDGLVMNADMAERYKASYGLPVLHDFRGQFTGQETGSAKNDAYRWAIRQFLDTGLCGTHRICLYEDSFFARAKCDLSYVVTRDWAVFGKCFVYDLSPWGDEAPKDDLKQKVGTDLATYKQLLTSLLKRTAGSEMTECCGFFCFTKYSNQPGYPSSHADVETEWENVALITPYNVYQNTVAHGCYNQSVHSQAPQKAMKQGRPDLSGSPQKGKTYLAVLMADYDSTTPLYEYFLSRNIWNDPRRGEIPLLWGINPNLSQTYPDIMQYLYETKTPNDWFAADASCAGYFNPTLVPASSLSLFTAHNQKFYAQWDMTISPMVLDVKDATEGVKDAFAQFSPDGYATIVSGRSYHLTPRVWKGMPMVDLYNDVFNACDISDPAEVARRMSAVIPATESDAPRFYLFRMVWTRPSHVIRSLESLLAQRPDLDLVVLDAYQFFDYAEQIAQ